MDKKKYKVVYDRVNCTGVLACIPFHPKRWSINQEDAKADLEGGIEDPNKPGTFVLEFSEEELDQFKASAEICPVNVIHIIDMETGEEIQ